MSPELLHPERFGMPESENNRPTRQSDCYALGMIIYEVGVLSNRSVIADSLPAIPQVLCGHHPYVGFSSDILAVNEIMEGDHQRMRNGSGSVMNCGGLLS